MGLNQLISLLSLLAFSSAIAAVIPPREECGFTKTVFQTVTETATEILCEASGTNIATYSASPSGSTSTISEITTIIATSTTTETLTPKQSTVTVTVEPFTSEQSQTATIEAPVATSQTSGIFESRSPVPSSTITPIITITTTATIVPTPPYANSTILIATSRTNDNGTLTSRGGGSLRTVTRTGAFYSSYPFSRTITGTGNSSLPTFQTSISSHTQTSPYVPITTHPSSTAVPATLSQTTNPLTSSANTTNILTPTPSEGSSLTLIPYTSSPLPSSTAVDDNSGVISGSTTSVPSFSSPSSTILTSFSVYSSSSIMTSSAPTISEPSSPSVYATAVTSKPGYFDYDSKINKRHRGGGENSEEGEGYWGNARRV